MAHSRSALPGGLVLDHCRTFAPSWGWLPCPSPPLLIPPLSQVRRQMRVHQLFNPTRPLPLYQNQTSKHPVITILAARPVNLAPSPIPTDPYLSVPCLFVPCERPEPSSHAFISRAYCGTSSKGKRNRRLRLSGGSAYRLASPLIARCVRQTLASKHLPESHHITDSPQGTTYASNQATKQSLSRLTQSIRVRGWGTHAHCTASYFI